MRNKPDLLPVFFLRLALCFLTCFLILYHPLVVISYDFSAALLWFGLLPLSQILAFCLSIPGRQNFFSSGLFFNLLALGIYVGLVDGFSDLSLTALFVAFGSHVTTLAIFNHKKWAGFLIPLEQLFFLYINVRLASFARGFDAERVNPVLSHALLAFSLILFLLHGAAVFYIFYRDPSGRLSLKEGIISAIITSGVLLFLLIPPESVDNLTTSSLLQTRANVIPVENSSQNNSNRQETQNNGTILKGIPAREWAEEMETIQKQHYYEQDSSLAGYEDSLRQHAVAIVASSYGKTLLLAGDYYGKPDSARGFVAGDERLNQFKELKLITAWKKEQSFSLSAQQDSPGFTWVNALVITHFPERYLPFEPWEVLPTIRKNELFPFEFSYGFTSLIPQFPGILENLASQYIKAPGENAGELSSAITDAGETGKQISLSDEAASSLDEFLPPLQQVPSYPREAEPVFLEHALAGEDHGFFSQYVDELMPHGASYVEKLTYLLKHYSNFQYQTGFTNNISAGHTKDFLEKTRAGDCTEFSTSLALLCRYAGIASRVVTGYAASPLMQQVNHKNALKYYYSHIPHLSGYAIEDLVMVTTAHRHSWVQVYVPARGWVDVDPASYAIAPAPVSDRNLAPLYMPLFEEQNTSHNFWSNLPWIVLLRLIGLLILAAFLVIYSFKALGLVRLKALSGQKNHRGVDALYTLLLISLAEAGRPGKKTWQSGREYAEKHWEIAKPTASYEALRYGSLESGPSWIQFKKDIADSRRLLGTNKFKNRLRAFLSLKSLYYL